MTIDWSASCFDASFCNLWGLSDSWSRISRRKKSVVTWQVTCDEMIFQGFFAFKFHGHLCLCCSSISGHSIIFCSLLIFQFIRDFLISFLFCLILGPKATWQQRIPNGKQIFVHVSSCHVSLGIFSIICNDSWIPGWDVSSRDSVLDGYLRGSLGFCCSLWSIPSRLLQLVLHECQSGNKRDDVIWRTLVFPWNMNNSSSIDILLDTLRFLYFCRVQVMHQMSE